MLSAASVSVYRRDATYVDVDVDVTARRRRGGRRCVYAGALGSVSVGIGEASACKSRAANHKTFIESNRNEYEFCSCDSSQDGSRERKREMEGEERGEREKKIE